MLTFCVSHNNFAFIELQPKSSQILKFLPKEIFYELLIFLHIIENSTLKIHLQKFKYMN